MDHTVLNKKLQNEIDSLVSKNRDIFNTVVGVATTDGDFNWSGAAGIADSDQEIAMTVDTPIFIASITKLYTAAAVASWSLVELEFITVTISLTPVPEGR